MRYYLHKMIYDMKDKLIKNRLLLLRMGCLLITALLFTSIATQSAKAATGLKIYDYATKKNTTYTGAQAKVTLNGEVISNEYTPGILVNGVALLPYNDIFEKSEIDADCIYDKNKGTVTITKNGTTIKMTIGSKKAKVNGKSVNLSIAPMKIKYRDVEIAKVLVPSRFVAETLGIKYTWNSKTSTIAMVYNSSSMKLSYNDDKAFEYTGTKGKVTLDGKNIDLGKMPSIITNNTAMLRAKKVFADSKIAADYTYNSKDKTVTLTKGDKKLVMTIGSKTAYLNGKSIKLDTAPLIVTNYATKASYVMVPGSVTATSLGYDYSWNKDKQTSVITTRKESGSSGENIDQIPAPELGDSGVINETGTILQQWDSIASLIGQSSNIHTINSGVAPSEEIGIIHSVVRDYTYVKQNSETFTIMNSTPMESITSSVKDNKISIQVANTSCYDQTYPMLGMDSYYVNTISIMNRTESNSTTVELDLVTKDFTYDIALSQDKMNLYVTVYMNSLLNASVSTGDSGDFLVLTGVRPLKVDISEDSSFLYVDLPYTTNGLGDIYSQFTGTKYIDQLFTIASPDNTKLILGMNQGYKYYISDEGNKFIISILSQTDVHQPQLPDSTGEDIGDSSQYEIIIRRPEGLGASNITDEDDYFNNRFRIRLDGDYTSFFNSNPISSNYSLIKNISVSYSNGYTEILITTTKLQGYELKYDKDYIYVNVGNPRDIYKNIVVLDPGHGGPATGAQYYGANEKDINLKILYTIGNNYFNSDPASLKVYYTRTTDVDMSLKDRAAYAKKMGADLFVSLHMNAIATKSAYSSVYGTEVYYSASNNSPNGSGLTSSKLATLLVNNLTGRLGTYNRGAKSAKYTVVHSNTVPAVLIELGFMTNKNDFGKITDATFQDKAARVIYETLLQIFEAYPTGR